MYNATTNGIRVTVIPNYLEEHSKPELSQYFWSYTIEIINESEQTVQLLSRHWSIMDGKGVKEEVIGDGVVGEQPVLDPGQSFQYTSGVPLATPTGFMVGSYSMVDPNGQKFDIDVPSFSLDSPFMNKSVN